MTKELLEIERSAAETEYNVAEPLVCTTGMCGTTSVPSLAGVCKLVFSSFLVLHLDLRRRGKAYPLFEKQESMQKNILRQSILCILR